MVKFEIELLNLNDFRRLNKLLNLSRDALKNAKRYDWSEGYGLYRDYELLDVVQAQISDQIAVFNKVEKEVNEQN